MSRNFWLHPSVLALVAITLSPSGAVADTILYTNLNPGSGPAFDSTTSWFVAGSNATYNQVMAMPFSLTAAGTVSNALLALGNFSDLPNDQPVSLYFESDASGMPGSIIGSLTQAGTIPNRTNPGPGLVSFHCTAGCSLLANTPYWLVAQETDPNSEQGWYYVYNDANVTLAQNEHGSATGPWTLNHAAEAAFQLDAPTPTPEPASFALAGSAVLGLALARKRMGRRARAS